MFGLSKKERDKKGVKPTGIFVSRPTSSVEDDLECTLTEKHLYSRFFRTPLPAGLDTIEFMRATVDSYDNNLYTIEKFQIKPAGFTPDKGDKVEMIQGRPAVRGAFAEDKSLFYALLALASYEATQMPLFKGTGMGIAASPFDGQYFRTIARQANILFDQQGLPVLINHSMISSKNHDVCDNLDPEDLVILRQWQEEERVRSEKQTLAARKAEINRKSMVEILCAFKLSQAFAEAKAQTPMDEAHRMVASLELAGRVSLVKHAATIALNRYGSDSALSDLSHNCLAAATEETGTPSYFERLGADKDHVDQEVQNLHKALHFSCVLFHCMLLARDAAHHSFSSQQIKAFDTEKNPSFDNRLSRFTDTFMKLQSLPWDEKLDKAAVCMVAMENGQSDSCKSIAESYKTHLEEFHARLNTRIQERQAQISPPAP